jgi:endonuclease YncB( thermonuclease family)
MMQKCGKSAAHVMASGRAPSSAEEAAAVVRAASETAREAASRATRAARKAQDRVLDAASKTPVLSKRFSPDYIRGATELFLTGAVVGLTVLVLRRGLVRYRVENDIPRRLLKGKTTLHGYVMRVTDGDGLRFYHQPWIRRVMFPKMQTMRKISDQTINVRLSGIDAPETAHFGNPAQAYGNEAKQWLKDLAEQRHASLRIHSIDQYKRVLGSVHVKHSNPLLRVLGLGRKNLSLELAKNGYAVVYTGVGAEYGGQLAALKAAERAAKTRRSGMWKTTNPMSPGEFKALSRKGSNSPKSSGSAQGFINPAQVLAAARFVFDFAQAILPRAPLSRELKQRKSRVGHTRRK